MFTDSNEIAFARIEANSIQFSIFLHGKCIMFKCFILFTQSLFFKEISIFCASWSSKLFHDRFNSSNSCYFDRNSVRIDKFSLSLSHILFSLRSSILSFVRLLFARASSNFFPSYALLVKFMKFNFKILSKFCRTIASNALINASRAGSWISLIRFISIRSSYWEFSMSLLNTYSSSLRRSCYFGGNLSKINCLRPCSSSWKETAVSIISLMGAELLQKSHCILTDLTFF